MLEGKLKNENAIVSFNNMYMIIKKYFNFIDGMGIFEDSHIFVYLLIFIDIL